MAVARLSERLARVREPQPRMPLRTAVFAAVMERFGRSSIVGLDARGIEVSRQWVPPQRWPHTWITGGVSAEVRMDERSFPCRDGVSRPIRLYTPLYVPGPLPVVVYYHGGGYVLGNTRMYDPLCSHLAASVPAVVASVDYRQAPEHRAPQAVLDAVDGLRWMHRQAPGLRADPQRIAVCGDSAGGGIAALVCHAAYDDGGPPIVHQALIYPCTDATQSFPSARLHAHAPILDAEKIRIFTDHYLGGQIEPTDPRVSCYWRADLAGMPPALVQTADLDPLRDEGLAYADRLAAAGIPTRATNYLRAVHGFASFPGATTNGDQARHELVTELRRHLHPGRGHV